MVRLPTLTIEDLRGASFPVAWETAAKLFCSRERLLSSNLNSNYSCCGGYFGPSYTPRHCPCRTAAVVNEVFNADFEAMNSNPISSGPPLPTSKSNYSGIHQISDSNYYNPDKILNWSRSRRRRRAREDCRLSHPCVGKRYHSAAVHVQYSSFLVTYTYTNTYLEIIQSCPEFQKGWFYLKNSLHAGAHAATHQSPHVLPVT